MLTLLSAVLLSEIWVLPVDDEACRKAPKGWIRGVVRIDDKLTAPMVRTGSPAPKETVAVVKRWRPIPTGIIDEGTVGYTAVDANGAFSIDVDPRLRGRLLSVSIDIQLDLTTEHASLTFAPSLFKEGLCLEVFLRKDFYP